MPRPCRGVESAPVPFRYSRSVQFADTDMAGIVHFSMYFRYMEEAEHALWRAAGLRVFHGRNEAGWPRVAATFDYKSPLRFEDTFDIDVDVTATTRRTVQYTFTLTREETLVGKGTLTAVCAQRRDGALEPIEVPAEVVARLRETIAAADAARPGSSHRG
jgi:acyl-CoA thioester hydrolase